MVQRYYQEAGIRMDILRLYLDIFRFKEKTKALL